MAGRGAAALVRDAVRQAAPVRRALQAALPPRGPGDRPQRLEGHPRAARAHRLDALRRTWAAPWPGQMLVVVEPQPMLAPAVALGADGHAQERSWRGQGLPFVDPDALWSADRHVGPVDVLCGMAERGAAW